MDDDDDDDFCFYPEVVECGAGHSLPGDVLGEVFHHSWLLHGEDGARNQLPVIADRKVPRPDPHHVVESELHNQTAFGVNLKLTGRKHRNVSVSL